MENHISLTKCKLKTRMRELWHDHVGWTRNAILCLVDGTPGAIQTVNRLYQNQVDIGDLIKSYYGEKGGNELTRLLKEHITIAGDVINAAKIVYGDNSIKVDIIKGGKADGKTLEDIARIHNIPLSQIETQLYLGINIELEHTNSKIIAREIAMDHLVEIPDYYDRLIKMENEYKKEKNITEDDEKIDTTPNKIVDNKGLDIAIKKWYDNADEIAVFLSNANPYLKLDDMKEMMKRHLDTTTDEVVARIKKDYNADIIATDKVYEHIRRMSDVIYLGIVKQFPEKF